MGVVRAWVRGIARAGGVALLVPVAVALAVGLTAAIGGGQRVRALGQVVGGPSIPYDDSRLVDTAAHGPAVPPRRAATRRAGAGSAAGALPVTRRAAERPASPVLWPPAPRASRPAPARTPALRPGPQAPSAPAPLPATPPAPTTPDDSPVRELGGQVAQTAGQVPVAGAPAQDAVQAIVDLIAPPPRDH